MRGDRFWMWLTAALAVPLSLAVLWYLRDHAYPRIDAGDFFIHSQESYRFFWAKGLWAGLKRAYLIRGKPLIMAPMGFLFLLATGGRVVPAAALSMIFCYAVFLLYLFLSVRKVSESWRATWVTVLLGTIPWVSSSVHGFVAEVPFLAGCAATIYFFISSRFGESYRNSALMGVALAFAICTRPAEAVAIFGLPVAVWSWMAWRQRRISILDFALSLPFVGVVGWVFLKKGSDPDFNFARLSYAALALPGVLAWAIAKFRGFKGDRLSYPAAFGLTFGLSVAWLAPVFGNLYSWMFSNTFSSDSMATGGRAHQPHWQFVLGVFQSLGGWLLLFLAALAVMAVFWGEARAGIKKGLPWIAASIGGAVPLLWIGSLTYNPDLRYYYVIFAFFFAACAALALHPRGLLWKPRTAVALGLILVNAFYGFGNAFGSIQPPQWLPLVQNTLVDQQPVRSDPALRLEAELEPLLDSQTLTERQIRTRGDEWWSDRTCIGVLPLGTDEQVRYAMDPWALQLISGERRRYWQATWPFSAGEPLSKTLKSYRTRFDYFLVGPVHAKELLGADRRDNTRENLAERIVRAWRKGKLKQIGLRLVGTVPVTGSADRTYQLLLVRLRNSG